MTPSPDTVHFTRRAFLGLGAAAMILQTVLAQKASSARHRIKIGLIGAGGRGAWRGQITLFFRFVRFPHGDRKRRAIDSCLACILGKEAAARNTELTMEQVLKENRRLELDLTGLKS